MSIQKKIEQGREYRKMLLQANTENEDYIVEGYATTFNEPYHLYNTNDGKEVREMVDAEAFKNTDLEDVIFQFDHEGAVFARISNNTLDLKTDEHGLFVRAFLGGTQNGRNLFEEIKGGYITKMSFGFTVKDSSMDADGDGYLRTIKEIGKLYDVSAVSIPANDFTEISARNQCDGVIAEIESERIRLEEEQRKLAEQKEILVEKLKALRKE